MNQPIATGEKKATSAPQATPALVPLVGSITAKNRSQIQAYTNVPGTPLVGDVSYGDDGRVSTLAITDAAALVEMARVLNMPPEQREKQMQGGTLSFEEEVIVRERDRPSFVVQSGALKGVDGLWAPKLQAAMEEWLPRAIGAVGRVDDQRGHLGTGFLALPDVVVTNRHVAEEIVRYRAGKYTLKNSPCVNFVDGDDPVIPFSEIVYYNEDEEIDLALFKLERAAVGRTPLQTSDAPKPAADTPIAVIGFPAKPTSLPAWQMTRIEKVFGSEYGVKRVAVGKVFELPAVAADWHFAHDASTLGGSSGSLVADLTTGEPLGVHFGGWPDRSNHAVYFHHVKRLLEHWLGRETA